MNRRSSQPIEAPQVTAFFVPPPPPSLTGYPAESSFQDLQLAIEPQSTSRAQPTSPSEFHANFLLSMGEPPHPELDSAIASGDDALVQVELARARSRWPQPSVTFNTAINRAIECEQLGVLNFLLKCGIRANDRNLETAIVGGNISLVARIIEAMPGAINTRLEKGHTVLSLAVLHEDLIVWLLSQGAEPNLQDAWSEMPLSRAVEQGCYGVIEVLLNAGADVKQGSPLHMSLRLKDQKQSLYYVARFLALGAPVDQYQGESSSLWDKVGFQRGTALHSASVKGNLGALQMLLAHGADPLRKQMVHSLEITGSTALDAAKNRGHTDIISGLQDYIDSNAKHSKLHL
ncbi:hypothetical protein LTR97_011326 [Elasticomyces elasticus]|uniref:Uncharacterized protein n=1 Tax=Elasticomyces elasticus TaxID=574655 RepID=A0AAN7VT78_9PEZI|nr:hypothetical protein LTR97_011326 [Elasticomyces elasticus]